MLYNNTIPDPEDYFIPNKHNKNIYIKYSDININYDYTLEISITNKYDITLEKLLKLLISNYIYIYPHIFSHNQIDGDVSNLDIYKYVDNTIKTTNDSFIVNNVSNTVYIIDTRAVTPYMSIFNKYYNTTTLNYSSGSELSLRINSLYLKYLGNNELQIKYSIDIVNIGIGFKEGDKVSVKFDNIELILTISLITISNIEKTNLYNTYNSYNQIINDTINNNIINEVINTEEDSLYVKSGDITISNNYNYKINISDKLYTNNLHNESDVCNYVTSLLLSLLGYYKLRNQKNNDLSDLDFNIITPTLVKKYNNKFVGLYLSTSLRNINNLNNIHIYNLDLLNYIKSNDAELFNIDLSISGSNVIHDFNNLIKTYDNIKFDNVLNFTVTTNNQYATSSFIATKTQNSISETLPIITRHEENKVNTLIDVSSIKEKDCYNTFVNISINTISEDLINSTIYNFILTRTSEISNMIGIKHINVFSSNILKYSLDTIQDNSNIYFIENNTNTIEIILDNIYSNITDININGVSVTSNNSNSSIHNYSYKYNFTPTYDKSIINLTVSAEDEVATCTYNLNLITYPI